MLKLLESLNQASLFEIFRLKSMLNKILDNPEKLAEIRRVLYLQQKITYFDLALNKEVEATILEIRRTTVTVLNHEDGKRWNLPMYMLNVTGIQTEIKNPKNKVDRLTLKVGESVGFFCRRENVELYGVVVKLNPKTASIQVSDTQYGQTWHVYYASLFYVIDTIESFVALENNNLSIAPGYPELKIAHNCK